MLNPSRFVLAAAVVAIAAAGFGAAKIWHHARTETPIALASGTLIKPSRSLPAFALLDHHHRVFGPADLQGHWSMLFFGFTHCPDLCPTTLTTLAAMQKRLRAEHDAVRPEVVFVSVDAERDTPAQLARYVPFFDADFVGVTAQTQSQIAAFATAMGVAVVIGPKVDGNYSVDHSGAIFVIDPAGKLAAILTGPDTTDGLVSDFRRILAANR